MGSAQGQVTNLTRNDYLPPLINTASGIVTDQRVIFVYQ
jgi:hypothetical protein